jgi:dTDP-4-amino-4,6-dideoxygalactose transaminase
MPSRVAFGEPERQAVDRLFEHYWAAGTDFGYQGEYERRYTEAFAQYLGGGHADAVCTGTAALFVALAALQLPPGSQVIVSPITDPGTVNAILFNRLVPVVADSMPDSYNMGEEQFLARVTDKTRAVMVVHATGRAAPIDRIVEAAKTRGIRVIEDCSQAHGAELNGRKAGTFGDIAAFSTVYTKGHATGGCGGVVFTRDRALSDLARAHADRGKPYGRGDVNHRNPMEYQFPALNLNIDEISCVIGLSTLAKLDAVRERRNRFLSELQEALRSSVSCVLMEISPRHSPFFQPVFVKEGVLTCSKSTFAEAVRAEGIPLTPHYPCVVCEWPWLKPHLADDFQSVNAIDCRNRSFNLSLNENYGRAEVEDIIAAIRKVENAFRR